MSERLRGLGLSEDSSEGAPTCRWRYRELIIDVMPTDERVLGFSSRWYAPAVAAAQHVIVADVDVRVVTPVYFLATKFEAFRGRGRNDYRGSHDLEDVIAVIDGRPELLRELAEAPDDVRSYIASQLGELLRTRAFVDALPGFLLPDSASQGRLPLLMERLRTLSQSAR